MIIDSHEIMALSVRGMWNNYVEAMDAAIVAAKTGDRQSATFYAAVVRVTLEIYFNEVERLVQAT